MGKAISFCTKEKGAFGGYIKLLQRYRCRGRQSGHNLITLCLESIYTGLYLGIPMGGHPFLGTHSDFGIQAFAIFFLYHVRRLYAKNLTGANHRAGIVHLENIFYGYGKVLGSIGENLSEPLLALLGNKIL